MRITNHGERLLFTFYRENIIQFTVHSINIGFYRDVFVCLTLHSHKFNALKRAIITNSLLSNIISSIVRSHHYTCIILNC